MNMMFHTKKLKIIRIYCWKYKIVNEIKKIENNVWTIMHKKVYN